MVLTLQKRINYCFHHPTVRLIAPFFSPSQQWLLVAGVALLLACATEAQQQRRLRVRPRVIQQEQQNSAELDSVEEQDNRPAPQQAIQYYRAQARNEEEDPRQLVLVASDDEYNGQYGTPTPRARADTYRPKVTTAAPIQNARSKVPETRAPPVQTIRNYNKVNDDGSFTFGYEAADGSFKEETRGTDCVVRGKYGYIDPDGNKREFTYVSGNPCDPNNPEGSEEEEEKSESEEANENVPQNYPRRPLAPRPVPTRPAPTTPRPTTTVFQNNYNNGYNQQQEESEEEIQIGQRARPAARPFQQQTQTVTQRPRVQIVSTTPNTVYHQPTQTLPVNITPKPVYRVAPQNTLQTQPPPTTYRPETTTGGGSFFSTTKGNALLGGTRQPLDFDAEFKKFQQENKVQPTSARPISSSTQKQVTNNPIYQTQLVFDPQTGQYDSALYQQLPQSQDNFQLNHRIQPYVHNPIHQQQQQHQLVSLDQLQQQSPLYRTQPAPQAVQQQQQIPQQIYQKQQNELQFINSQQLFAQQLELQQSQLRADRVEASKKYPQQQQLQQHRFQASSPQIHRVPQPQQQYYFIQPQGAPQAGGQIDAFLRGHNIEY